MNPLLSSSSAITNNSATAVQLPNSSNRKRKAEDLDAAESIASLSSASSTQQTNHDVNQVSLEAIKKFAAFSKIYNEIIDMLSSFEKSKDAAHHYALYKSNLENGDISKLSVPVRAKIASIYEMFDYIKAGMEFLKPQLQQFNYDRYPFQDIDQRDSLVTIKKKIHTIIKTIFGTLLDEVQLLPNLKPSPQQLKSAKLIKSSFRNGHHSLWCSALLTFKAPPTPKLKTPIIFIGLPPGSIVKKSAAIVFDFSIGRTFYYLEKNENEWHESTASKQIFRRNSSYYQGNWNFIFSNDANYTFDAHIIGLIDQVEAVQSAKMARNVLSGFAVMNRNSIDVVCQYLPEIFYLEDDTTASFCDWKFTD